MMSAKASITPLMLSLQGPVVVVGAAVAPVTALAVVPDVVADAMLVVRADRKSGPKYSNQAKKKLCDRNM